MAILNSVLGMIGKGKTKDRGGGWCRLNQRKDVKNLGNVLQSPEKVAQE